MSWILRFLTRGMLRGFSTPTLYELHARATAELSPEAARTARTLIAAEVSRRARKDY